MPDIFTSLDMAREYLELIMRRMYHFLGYAVSDRPARFRLEENMPCGNDGGVWTNSWISEKAHGKAPDMRPDEAGVQQEMHLSTNRRWAHAFQPLLRPALENTKYLSSQRAMLLKLHSLTVGVRMAGHLSKSQLIYDRFTREFEEIIKLSRLLLEGIDTGKPLVGGDFSFDMGVILPLATPAISCRDRKLRREAIELMRSKRIREFQWPIDTTVDVATFLLELEEEGVETEYIPEEARARLVINRCGSRCKDRTSTCHKGNWRKHNTPSKLEGFERGRRLARESVWGSKVPLGDTDFEI